MAEKVIMLALSPTMEEGTILKWQVKEGDVIKMDQTLCEVETDKASMDLNSTQEGMILKIIKKEGESCKVEQTVAIIGEKGEDINALLQEVEKENKQETPPAPAQTEIKTEASNQAPTPTESNSSSFKNTGKVQASPLARKLAEINELDLSLIPPTGPNGRVIKRDIEEAIKNGIGKAGSQGQNAAGVTLEEKLIPVSKKTALIAQRLTQSKQEYPHFYLKASIDMSKILEFRKATNVKGTKISVNSYLIKLIACAILKNPVMNTTWEGANLHQHGQVNIGFAVSQNDGSLITPTILSAQSKGLNSIQEDLLDLIERARIGKLKSNEYTQGYFTISSLSSFGTEEFFSIINPPGPAILAVGATTKQPCVVNDEIVIRPIMKVTLSCDHRVINGSAGAKFLQDFKNMAENPFYLLF